MGLLYHPLLLQQRKLYDSPRGFERFRQYLDELTSADGDMELPLSYVNPMGKEHVPDRLDEYIQREADEIAAVATGRAAERLSFFTGDFRVSLILADDAAGGWTRRETTEADHRYFKAGERKRGWITVLLWTSENPATVDPARETAAAIYRTAALSVLGRPVHSLGDIALLESLSDGFARSIDASAAAHDSGLDADDRAHELLARHAGSTDYPLIFALWYGDEAARAMGYDPAGVEAGAVKQAAGRWARAYLKRSGTTPEDCLRRPADLEPATIFRE